MAQRIIISFAMAWLKPGFKVDLDVVEWALNNVFMLKKPRVRLN